MFGKNAPHPSRPTLGGESRKKCLVAPAPARYAPGKRTHEVWRPGAPSSLFRVCLRIMNPGAGRETANAGGYTRSDGFDGRPARSRCLPKHRLRIASLPAVIAGGIAVSSPAQWPIVICRPSPGGRVSGAVRFLTFLAEAHRGCYSRGMFMSETRLAERANRVRVVGRQFARAPTACARRADVVRPTGLARRAAARTVAELDNYVQLSQVGGGRGRVFPRRALGISHRERNGCCHVAHGIAGSGSITPS